MENMIIYDINNSGNNPFVEVSFDSIFKAKNITYSNSNSLLYSSSFSEMSFEDLTFINITNANGLLLFSRSGPVVIKDIKFQNSTTKTNQLIFIDYSKQVSISDISVKDYSNTFLFFKNSQVDIIENIHIQNYRRGIKVVKSTISNITNSSFKQTGDSSFTFGGALYLEQSDVSLYNTSFSESKAKSGAAISHL